LESKIIEKKAIFQFKSAKKRSFIYFKDANLKENIKKDKFFRQKKSLLN
jgi:hypothetical protein